MELQPGDIMACFGTDLVSRGISLQTAWPLAPRGLRLGPSHVALICPQVPSGPLRWFESTTLCPRPCLIRRRRVSGAQCHEPEARVHDYVRRGGRVHVYRLSQLDQLTEGEVAHLAKMLCHVTDSALDYNTGGAIVSGLRVVSRLPSLFRINGRMDDVFCSQLIAAVLQRRHRMNRSNPSTFNPARLLRTLVREGTYGFSHEITEPLGPATIPFPLWQPTHLERRHAQ